MPVTFRHRRQPVGLPRPDDFAMCEEPVPEPTVGQVVVRTTYISVDPGLRSRIRDIPDDELVGAVVLGSALGRVHAPGTSRLAPGQLVRGKWGWVEYAAVDVTALEVVDEQPDVDPADEVGVLGVSGLVAYVGLVDVGRPREGESLYVSAAAGAIGSTVGQMARALGLRVIGSAGSDEKVALLEELGFDRAFNYHTSSTAQELASFAPDGIDVYFDNVGGDQLQAALDAMAEHGRIVCCGSVSTYNGDARGPALFGLRQLVTKRIKMEGYVIWDHADRRAAQRRDTLEWIRSGRLRPLRTTVQGIENTPQAFVDLLSGRNIGKASVHVW